MRIGLLSDTHSYIDDNILDHFSECDEVWHAGDIGDISVTDRINGIKPLRAVYGNIDNQEIRRSFPLDNRFEIDGFKVWITHIGGYPGRYNKRVYDEFQKNSPDLFICGHSHILKAMFDKQFQFLHLNPGACGNHGFHKVRTIMRLTIEDKKVKDLQVIELGYRG